MYFLKSLFFHGLAQSFPPRIAQVTWAQKIGAGIGYKMMFDWSLQFNWFDDGNDEVPDGILR